MLNVYYIGKCAKFCTFQIRPNNSLALEKAEVQKMKSTTLINLRGVSKNYPSGVIHHHADNQNRIIHQRKLYRMMHNYTFLNLASIEILFF